MMKLLALLLWLNVFRVSNTFDVNEKVSFTSDWRGVCGKRTSKFFSKTHTSLADCLKECGARPKCKAVNYRHLFTGLCELMLDTETSESQVGCLFISKENITFSGMRATGCGCEDGQICDVKTGTCSKKECMPVLEINYGQILGNMYKIGSRLQMTCDTDIKPQHQLLECLADGEWDETPACTAYSCPSDPGWFRFGTNCYTIYRQLLTFHDAGLFCKDEGSSVLVRVDTEEENAFLKSEVEKVAIRYGRSHYWLGMKYIEPGNRWIWVGSGDDITYTDWGSGQPNDGISQQCAVLAVQDQWKWHDIECHKMCRPMCMKPATVIIG